MIKVNPNLTVGEISQICRDTGACAGCQFFGRQELDCAFYETSPENLEFDLDRQEDSNGR